MSNPIRKIELIEGGTIIKQGEIFTLGFRLFSAQGELIVPEQDQIVSIKIANKEGVIFTTNAVTVDDHIEFTVEGNLGYGNMRLEIKVTDGVDTLQKFPSDGWIELLITPSLDDIGVGGIDKVTAEEMFAAIAVIDGIAADALDVSITAEDNSLIAVGIANAADVKSNTALAASTSAEASASASVIKSEAATVISNDAIAQAAAANTKSDTAIVTADGARVTADEAKARADLIIATSGTSSTEQVDSRLGADLVARATSGTLIREIHSNQLETARQTTTLVNGVSVVTGGVDALAETEIEGRTLISLANSNLEATKQYVVADKKTKVLVDGVTQSGVAKFTKGTTTVSTANFVGKVAGSTVVNPHSAFRGSSSTLYPSNAIITELLDTQYAQIRTLEGTVQPASNGNSNLSGYMAQHLFHFDIIAEIERKLGVIPKATLAEKVQWVKDNVESIVGSWHGFGSSVGGNKAYLSGWSNTGNAWDGAVIHSSGSVANISYPIVTATISSMVDANGFVHFLAYADPSNGTIASSISTDYISALVTLKATAQLNTRPTIIRVENFEGKVSGSVVENAHVSKRVGTQATLQTPTGTWAEYTSVDYPKLGALDGSLQTQSTLLTSGLIAQHLFSFNLIEAIERNIGKIPRTSVADKVQWLKSNVAKLTANWYGFGGNGAAFAIWDVGGTWSWGTSQPLGVVTKVVHNFGGVGFQIDANGLVHYIAYSNPSDGTTVSSINTDYIDLEIEIKPNADFTRPKVALYEVTATDYAKILVDWNADAVVNRYPVVEGVQHLQGVGVIAEGENLLPPFTEWNLNVNAKVINPYELELNATATSQQSYPYVPIVKGQIYTASVVTTTGRMIINEYDANKVYLRTLNGTAGIFTKTVTASSDAFFLAVILDSASSGTFNFKNPMLTLGTTAKPFVPRNPSYLYADVKLGAIGTVADRLYEQDGAKFVRKVVEKDFIMDGSLGWIFNSDNASSKAFHFTSPTGIIANGVGTITATKFNGSLLSRNVGTVSNADNAYAGSANVAVSVSDSDTGWGETFNPVQAEIKAYFYGWKMNNGVFGTPYEATGTKTWIPIGDTTNARAVTVVPTSASPTQLDGTIQPYKLSYVLATPQVINVTDKVEGSLKVNGLTQVEVLSGVVRREKVVPVTGSTATYINRATGMYTASRMKNKSLKILKVYKNGLEDKVWTITSDPVDAYGVQQAFVFNKDYDPTAEYTVTYLALDKPLLTANPTNIKLLYANNMRSSLEDTVGKVQDNTTQLSVHEKAIVDLYIRVKALGG